MKKKNLLKLFLIVFSVLLVTGCTKQLTDADKKAVKNPTTGQTLTENILCQPQDEETVNLYLANKVDLSKLPKCEDFKITTGGYEGLWTSIFVKPLAWAIIKIGNFAKNYGVGLIVVSLLIRLIAFPLTKKTAVQSELMKEAKPKLDKLEEKYKKQEEKLKGEGKNNQEYQAMMMKKNQEMMMIYKEYNINPIAGCLYAIIQIPLFIAFLEAINRVPAIFEENLLGFQLGTTPLTGLSNGNFLYLILTIIVGVTTFYSFKLNSASNPDNQQMKTMSRVMVIMILVTSVFMTSALNIYWIATNLFTVVQNLLVIKKKAKV